MCIFYLPWILGKNLFLCSSLYKTRKLKTVNTVIKRRFRKIVQIAWYKSRIYVAPCYFLWHLFLRPFWFCHSSSTCLVREGHDITMTVVVLHVMCLQFIADLTKPNFGWILIRIPSTKFHGNPSSSSSSRFVPCGPGRTGVTKLNRLSRFLLSCLEPIDFLKFCNRV